MAGKSYDRPDFGGDDFSEYEADERGFDAREDNGGRGPLILALAGGVLVVFGAVVWNTYAGGVRTDDDDVPVVLAQQAEYKRAPDAEDGMVQPDQSRRVYDQIETRPEEASAQTAAMRRTLRDESAGAGTPMDLRPAFNGQASGNAAGAESLEVLAGAEAGEEVAALGAPEVVLPALPPQSAPEIGLGAPEAAAPEALPVPTPEVPVRAAPQPKFAFAQDGEFLVQLAALRTEESANESWDKLVLSQPDTFRGATRFVQRADLGAKGVFYRLRAGSFAERDAAAAFCNAVKAAGGDCIVVQR